jgi:hypothetical protein
VEAFKQRNIEIKKENIKKNLPSYVKKIKRAKQVD